MNAKFRIGTVLGAGFRTWFKNFPPFLLLTVLAHSPLVIWGISILQHESTFARTRKAYGLLGASIFLMVPLDIFVAGLLTPGVVRQLQGQRAPFGTCITQGLARFFPVLGTTILMFLCVGGASFCVGIPFAFFGETPTTIAVCVVELFFYSMLYVSASASAIDRSGVIGSLGRSRTLVRGHKFALAILLILLILIHFGLQIAISAVAFSIGGRTFLQEPSVVYVWTSLACGVLVGSLGAVMASVAHYYLRAEKEGTSPAELATVFD
jgi:hypothetical protein